MKGRVGRGLTAAQGSSTQGRALVWQKCVHLFPEAKWFLIYILHVSGIQRKLFSEVTERVRATWRAQVALGMGRGASVSVCWGEPCHKKEDNHNCRDSPQEVRGLHPIITPQPEDISLGRWATRTSYFEGLQSLSMRKPEVCKKQRFCSDRAHTKSHTPTLSTDVVI